MYFEGSRVISTYASKRQCGSAIFEGNISEMDFCAGGGDTLAHFKCLNRCTFLLNFEKNRRDSKLQEEVSLGVLYLWPLKLFGKDRQRTLL